VRANLRYAAAVCAVSPALARARQDLARVPKGVVVLELLHQNARIGGRDLAATEHFLRQLDSGLVLEIHRLSSTLMANENPGKTSRTTGLRQQRRKDVKSKEAMNRIRVFIMVRGGHSDTSGTVDDCQLGCLAFRKLLARD